jgi:hypothetical protein
MSTVDCPYFDRDYKKCVLAGTYQDGYQKEGYCLSSNNWKSCSNYTHSSYNEKMSKKLRPDPELS